MELSCNISKHTAIVLTALLCLAIVGCNDRTTSKIKNTLGMTTKAPDEHSVINYPPLTVPPTLNANDLNAIYGAKTEVAPAKANLAYKGQTNPNTTGNIKLQVATKPNSSMNQQIAKNQK